MVRRRKSPRNAPLNRSDTWQLYTLLIPAAALILVFSYIPLYGIVIAFQDYQPGNSFLSLANVKWVGLKHFQNYIGSKFFTRTLVNTIRLSLMNLVFGFTMPILFALLLNEVRSLRYKKFVQTVSYLPYFISMVVVAGMVLSFLEINGLINNLLGLLGLTPKEYIVYPSTYPWIYTFTNVWKSFGFGSILYFSTISSIDPGQYEAARIDGANRWMQVWHITLPGLRNIIAINLIIAIGGILSANSELILLMYTPATYDVADVIGTYTYRMGIEGGQYSYTTAAGLFMSLIGFALTFAANKVSNRLTGYGLW